MRGSVCAANPGGMSFNHSLHKYLLSPYDDSDYGLSTADTVVNKSRQNPQPHGVHSLRAKQAACKPHKLYKIATVTDVPQERTCAVRGRLVPLRESASSLRDA